MSPSVVDMRNDIRWFDIVKGLMQIYSDTKKPLAGLLYAANDWSFKAFAVSFALDSLRPALWHTSLASMIIQRPDRALYSARYGFGWLNGCAASIEFMYYPQLTQKVAHASRLCANVNPYRSCSSAKPVAINTPLVYRRNDHWRNPPT